MAALGVEDLAFQAGVALETVLTFVDAGIVKVGDSGGFSEPDIARVRLVDSLVEAGLGLDELSRAVNDGRLSLSYVDFLMPEPVRMVRVPNNGRADGLEHEDALRLILGSERSPGEPMREDDFAILGVITEAIELGAPPDRVIRILRSIAQSAARLTDLQRDWVDEILLAPAIERTGSPISALEETSATRLRYREIGKKVTGLLMDRLVDDAIFRNLVELTEQALSDVGLRPTGEQQTIVFIDVSNYTQLAEERGDTESAHQASLLTDFVNRIARRRGGRLVKSLGDGAMVQASNQISGLAIALEAVSTAESAGLWPLHAGVNSGPMVRRDGDFFGAAVNIASRVADAAGPGEVVVTDSVVSAADDGHTRFVPLGDLHLRHVGTPIRLSRAEQMPG